MPELIPVEFPMLPPVGILSYLSSKSLGDLAGYGKFQKFKPNESVINEGMEQARLYIIVEGSLQITGMSSGKEILYGQIEPGECIGEVALFEGGFASATVKTLTESILWSLDIQELIQYLTEHLGGGGALLMGIARCLSHRLRAANQQVAKSYAQENQTPLMIKTAPLRVDSQPHTQSFLEKISKRIKGIEEGKFKISSHIKL